MTRTIGLVLLVLMAGGAAAQAQGTKDRPAAQASGGSSGVGTNSAPDPMGGAFKGTGMPSYGTSPGMNSPKKTRR